MDVDPKEQTAGVTSESSFMMLGDVDLVSMASYEDPMICGTAPVVLYEQVVPAVDWNNLTIVERQDDEGRIEMMSEDQLYSLLGLKDDDERAKKVQEERAKKEKNAWLKISLKKEMTLKVLLFWLAIPYQMRL